MSNPFHWNHRSLDQVCEKLDDFSTLLFSTKSLTDLDLLWNLTKEQLYPNIQKAALQTYIFDERTKEISELKSARAKTADVILFRKKGNTEGWDPTLLKHLEELPGAILAFSETSPKNWNTLFDITLELSEPTCKIHRKNNPQVEEVQFAFFEKPIQLPIQPPVPTTSETATTQGTIYFLEIEAALQKNLIRGIAFSNLNVQVIDPSQDIPDFSEGDFLITDLAEDHPKLQEYLDIAKSHSVPVIVIGKQLKRVEDRLRLYEWGSTFILPKEATNAEQVAAIISMLKFYGHSQVSATFAMDAWDLELQRLSQKVKRDLCWNENQSSELVGYYKAFVAHLIKRSQHSGTPCGIIRIPLPDLSEISTQKTSWYNLIRRTLLQSLIATVRQRDITFVFEDHLIIISGDISPLGSSYVVNRIQAQLKSLGEKDVKVELFSYQPQNLPFNEESEELLKSSIAKPFGAEGS